MKTISIRPPLSDVNENSTRNNTSKLEAFARLEAFRKAAAELIDYDAEREKAMLEKVEGRKHAEHKII